MAVTSCRLQRVQPTTTYNEENFGTYTLKYDIETSALMGHRLVANGAAVSSPNPLPTWGQTYSYQGDTDADAYAHNYIIESVPECQTRYMATVVFAPPPDGGSLESFEPNPFDRPPIVWIDRECYTRFVDRDIFGNEMKTKAGQPYIITPELEQVRGVLVVEFNVNSLSTVAGYMRTYSNATNSASWTLLGASIPPRTALCREVTSSPPVTQGLYTYYHLAFRFAFADEGENWDVPALERGQLWFKKESGEFVTEDFMGLTFKKLFADADGGERNLAADGTPLAEGEVGIFTDWRLRREVNFNSLPFSG